MKNNKKLFLIVLVILGFCTAGSETLAEEAASVASAPESSGQSQDQSQASPTTGIGSDSTATVASESAIAVQVPDFTASSSVSSGSVPASSTMGNASEAASSAMTASSSIKNVLAERVEKGQKLGRSGDYAKAKDVFRSILADEPENAKALFFLGICYGKLGQAAEAERFLKRLEKVDGGLSKKLKASLDQDAKKAAAKVSQLSRTNSRSGGDTKNSTQAKASGTSEMKEPGLTFTPPTPVPPKVPAKSVRFFYYLSALKGPVGLIQYGDELRLVGVGDQIGDWMQVDKITPDGLKVIDPKDSGRKATFILISSEYSPKPGSKADKIMSEIRKKWSGNVPETERLGVPVIKIYERDSERFALIDWDMRKILVQVGDKVDEMFRISVISSDSVEIINLFNQLPETYKPGQITP